MSNIHSLVNRSGWMISISLIILIIPVFIAFQGNSDPFPPSASPPANPRATPGADRIIISWDQPEIGYVTATGFSLYRSLDGIDFSFLSEVENDIFTFHDTTIIVGRTFHYYLRTDTDLGQSDNSDVIFSAADDEPPEIEIIKPGFNDTIGVRDTTIIFDLEEDGSGLSALYYRLDEEAPVTITDPTTIDLFDLEEGSHTIEIFAEDIAGNSDSAVREFTIDTIRPAVEILSPEDGDISPDGEFHFIWNMDDQGSGISSILINLDHGMWFEPLDQNSHKFLNLVHGPHLLSVKVRDEAGNSAEDSVNVLVDMTSPSLKVHSPLPGSIYNVDHVKIEWTGEDEISSVQFNARVDGGKWIRKDDSTYHIFSGLSEGDHIFEVEAVDSVGNSIVDSVHSLVDLTPPEITILNKYDPIRSYGGIVKIEFEVHDELSGIDQMDYRIDDGEWFMDHRSNTISINDLSHGDHHVYFRITDEAGNLKEEDHEISVDTDPPVLMDISPKGIIYIIPDRFEVEFSEIMEIDELEAQCSKFDIIIEGSGKRFFLYPDQNMDYGDSFTITLSGMDLNGIWMEKNSTQVTISNIVFIQGRVVDPGGKAMEGVKVFLGDGRTTTTGEDGIFNFEVKFDSYDIFATSEGYRRGESSIEAKPGDMNWVGTIRLEKEDISMRKQVTTMASDPVNIIILGLLILLIVIVSMAGWRYFDRDIITYVDIEMDEETD